MLGLLPLPEAHSTISFGNKVAGLAQACRVVAVPAGLAVANDWLAGCLTPSEQASLAQLLTELSRCSDDELTDLLEAISTALASMRLTADRRSQLHAAVGGLGPILVVRSSSADEDDNALSFAGVFDSIIDVAQADLDDAVERVWRSGFGPAALLQYRRLGRAPDLGHMSVLVQRAIQPEVAGVAFSEPTGDAFIEWTAGHAAALVDGRTAPTAERLDGSATLSSWRAELRSALLALGQDGQGHDVEWAWDGTQLWVVQVRPRTAALADAGAMGLRAVPLYEGDSHDLALGECGGEYHRIRAKRRRPRAIALSQGAAVPAGWLVNWDTAGSTQALVAWSRQLPGRVVIDASPTERQFIIERAELADTVGRLAAGGAPEFAFMCREYIKGETALLSTVSSDGSVYVESSDEGLLALNRGFGVARPISTIQLERLVGAAQAAALADTTVEHARQLHPRATLEWVVSDGSLYFVDYSAPAGRTGEAAATVNDGRVLSPGLASGQVQRLAIDATLTESSIAPIISIAQPVSAHDESRLLQQLHDRLRLGGAGVIVAAARPIAILSMLIGVVEGFLFEEGALLSHLGILLREAGVPAAIVGTGNLPAEGSLIDLVHGTVIVHNDADQAAASS